MAAENINTNINSHNDFNLNIVSNNVEYTILSNQINQFTIEESLYGKTTAELHLNDIYKLKALMPIVGGEIVNIQFRDNTSDIIMKYKFIIKTVNAETKDPEKFVSLDHSSLIIQMTEYNYNELDTNYFYSSIPNIQNLTVKEIFETLLKDYMIKNTDVKFDFSAVSQKYAKDLENFCIPSFLSLYEIIQYILPKIDSSKEDCGYYFFYDKVNSCFTIKSLSKIFSPSTFELTFDNTFSKVTYSNSFNNINDWVVVNNGNILNLIDNKFGKSTYVAPNLFTKNFESTEYSYDSTYKNFKNNSLLAKKEVLSRIPKYYSWYTRISTQSSMNEYYNNLKYEIHDTQMMLLLTNGKRTNSPGSMVYTIFPLDNQDIDMSISGTWLIGSVITTLDYMQYNQQLKLVRDEYYALTDDTRKVLL